MVTAGKETSSIGWDNVSTTVVVGLSIHAKMKNEVCFSVKWAKIQNKILKIDFEFCLVSCFLRKELVDGLICISAFS